MSTATIGRYKLIIRITGYGDEEEDCISWKVHLLKLRKGGNPDKASSWRTSHANPYREQFFTDQSTDSLEELAEQIAADRKCVLSKDKNVNIEFFRSLIYQELERKNFVPKAYKAQ